MNEQQSVDPQRSADPGPGGAGSRQPPGAAEPPGAAGAEAPDEPPPLTAFAWRSGLVRPAKGRMLAGVCAAIGRATNTDPVLWRVLLAVLAIFGGIGVILYLLGWLLLPADGDTGSPIEALLGRGRSATSAVLTVIGAVVVLLSFPVMVSEPFRPGPWGVILIGGALLLLLRDRRRGTGRATPATGPPTAPGTPPMPTFPASSGAPMTSASQPAAAPFAPHGPFVPASPPYPPPGDAASPPPPRPAPPKPPKSRLGLLTFSVLLVIVGAMGLVDLAGFSIPGPSYFAAALAVVGLGLIMGAWVGRARGLIALGLLLVFLTGTSAAVESVGRVQAGTQEWVVTSFDQLEPAYSQSFGEARLDLSELDFRDAPDPIDVDVSVDFGNFKVIVPPDVDVVVEGDIEVAGNADVFDQEWGGLDPGTRAMTDLGEDGRGGGELRINATVDFGSLEVQR
jgi:phage shock protein PspC (stress-responsive transcriptional regulator)